jgi:hypothetical protein
MGTRDRKVLPKAGRFFLRQEGLSSTHIGYMTKIATY